jgi:hypothetical protein
MTSKIPQSPTSPSNQDIPSLNDLLHSLQEAPDDKTSGKKCKFVHLSMDQFTMLMQCFSQQQKDISVLLQQHQSTSTNTPSSSPDDVCDDRLLQKPKPTDHYNNAKYEDIVCGPIKPAYTGTSYYYLYFTITLRHIELAEYVASTCSYVLCGPTYTVWLVQGPFLQRPL